MSLSTNHCDAVRVFHYAFFRSLTRGDIENSWSASHGKLNEESPILSHFGSCNDGVHANENIHAARSFSRQEAGAIYRNGVARQQNRRRRRAISVDKKYRCIIRW